MMYHSELAFLNIGTQEMLIIVFVILLLFGGKKLPELARGLGRGIREFKDASEGIKREISDQINNFEKDLEVKEENTPAAVTAAEEKVKAEQEITAALPPAADEDEQPKQKYTFTAPEGTIQHNPNKQLDYGEEATPVSYTQQVAAEQSNIPQVPPASEQTDTSKEA